MRYLAALDYNHLDNGVFLTSLATSIANQENTQPIILHGDSEYTDRIMQTGVMRDKAIIRSIKDLNHRLVALFADQGVSAIGLNGYQRKLITREEGALKLDSSFFDQLPDGPALLLSTLVWDTEREEAVPVPLAEMTAFLQDKLQTDATFVFSKSDKSEIFTSSESRKVSWSSLPPEVEEEHLPAEFVSFQHPLRITTARDFQKLSPETSLLTIK